MFHSTACARFRAILRKLLLLLFVFPLAMTLLQFALSDIVLAQQPDLAVDVIPSSVNFPPQGQIKVQVVVSNLSPTTLQAIQLSLSSYTNIEVANALPGVNALPPGGQYVWQVQLSRVGFGPLSGSVQLRVEYKRRIPGQPGLVSRVVFSSLTINSLKPDADVRVVTSLTSLTQQQPGVIYLVITNKSDFTLVMKNIMTKGPDFIRLSPEDLKGGLTIPSSQTRTIAVNVTTPGVVEPGNQLLVFEITYQWYDAGQWQQGNLVTNQQINADVLGESQILSLLGIPSLLVLPGFLGLATVRLMRNLLRDRSKPASNIPPLLDPTKPEFWLLAITLSGIAAFGYPWVTKWITGFSRNYLVRYELSDVVYIWLASILLAAGLYLLIVSIYRNYIRLRTPSENDQPITILYKLKRQKLSAWREKVALNVAGGMPPQHVYLIESYKVDKGEFWVSPSIEITETQQDGYDELRSKLALYRSLIDDLGRKNVLPLNHLNNYLQNPVFNRSTALLLAGLRFLVHVGSRLEQVQGGKFARRIVNRFAGYIAKRLSIFLLSDLAHLLAQGDQHAWYVHWGPLQPHNGLLKAKSGDIDFSAQTLEVMIFVV